MEYQQLVWRCRRGVRELDVLLGQYLEKSYGDLDQSGKAAFERLLEVQDPVIMDWLFGKYDSGDPEVQAIVQQLKSLSGL